VLRRARDGFAVDATAPRYNVYVADTDDVTPIPRMPERRLPPPRHAAMMSPSADTTLN